MSDEPVIPHLPTMRAAHIKDLPRGFGRALAHFRNAGSITVETLARNTEMRMEDITRMERGEREPTLTEFLRLALAIQIPPGELFNLAVVEWPDDPNFAPPNSRSRAHYPRLFRLAWIGERRVIHESRKAYENFEEALRASVKLNAVRQQQRLPLLVGVGVYVRTGTVWSVRDFLQREGSG